MRSAGIAAGILARISLATAATLAAPAAARAQATGTVAGEVTDPGRLPLPGVTVQLDGTRLGASTGNDGRYRIAAVPPGTYTVLTRRIGFNPQRATVTVTAGAEATASFSLQPSPVALDQIVVTGTAGATERRAIGNAVASISAVDALEKSAAPDIATLLNARAPGVTIIPRSGRLGAGPAINIRGRSSLSLENSPLVYVDGVRVSNATGTGPQGVGGLGTQGAQVGGRLNDINPEDIESIEIIKGPAAATIYGTEAANGVIQIITKRGASNSRPQVGLVVEQGSLWFRDPVGRTPTNYMREAATGNIVTWNGLQQEADSGREIYRTGQTRRYTGSLSGARDLFQYYVGSSYENDLGVEPNNTLRQFGFTANLNAPVRPSTELATSLKFTSIANRLGADVGASTLLGTSVGHRLLFPATRGFFAVPPEVPQQLYDNRADVNRFTGSGTVTNRPASWFTQRAIVGLDYSAEDARALERFAPPELARYVSAAAASGRVGQTLRRNSIVTGDYSGTAKFKLTDALGSSSSIGGQFYRTEQHTSFLGGTGFPGPGVNTVSAVATQVSATQQQIINTTIGAYGEQTFAWRDRLYLTGGLRVDNNSSFGEDFKWVTYPKVSASWVVHEEPFWGGALADAVKSFRLRAAYGESGRQPATFSALRTFNPVPGPGGTSAVTPGSLGNVELRPERGKEWEAGFETDLWSRLTLDFTWFSKRTIDAILNQPVAPSSGFPGNQVRNLGEVKNHGVELAATLQALARRPVSWEVTGNVATNRDEIVDLGGLPSLIATFGASNQVGYPIGGIWTRRVVSADRNPTTGQAANVLCEGPAGAAPLPCAQAPFVYIGTPTPRVTGAVSNTVTIGGKLRLYALADFKRGYRIFNAVEYLRCTGQTGAPLCRENYFPEGYDPVHLAEHASGAIAVGTVDQYMQDASFVKLREVSATYTLPERWTRSRASLTLAARELHTWTKYAGIDPENNQNNAATTALQQEQAVTPPLQRLIATINVTW